MPACLGSALQFSGKAWEAIGGGACFVNVGSGDLNPTGYWGCRFCSSRIPLGEGLESWVNSLRGVSLQGACPGDAE